jgi:hypothetical protein
MSALPNGYELAPVMALPSGFASGAGAAPLDLITSRTSPEKRCAKTFGMAGILGTWGVLVNVPCGQWSCASCGAKKARRYAGVARGGCELATERLRLVTVTMPREDPRESWRLLGLRFGRFSERVSYMLGSLPVDPDTGKQKRRRLTYFGTVELQRRGNPHLHLLTRDSGYLAKAALAAACTGSGFGFVDIRQIAAGAGVQYVTKYLHKSAGQEMPKGVRRIRRSRDWFTEPLTIKGTWGAGWQWQSIEGLDQDAVEVEMRAQGVLEVFRYDQRVDVAATD